MLDEIPPGTAFNKLCSDLLKIDEGHPPPPTNFTPPKNDGSGKLPKMVGTAEFILCSFNANGMDKRVKDVTSFLSEERIVALAVQEAKLNTNNLPKGFPEATYYRPYRKKLAIRGLIWLIHPDWASITTKVPALGGDSDHVFWIKVDTREGPVFLANVYIPNGRRPQDIVDANEAVAQLLKDVASLPEDAMIAAMGDWNADPFTGRGSNQARLKEILKNTSLEVVPKGHPTASTRRKSGTHIDNFLLSPTMLDLGINKIHYHNESNIGCRIPPPMGRDEPSDHTPISLKVLLNKAPPPRKGPARLVWDLNELKVPSTLAKYRSTIQHLTNAWMKWRNDIVDEWKKPLTMEKVSSTLLVTILFEGLVLVLNSAAYQSLPKKLARSTRRQPYLSSEVLPTASSKEVWKFVKSQLKAQEAPPPVIDIPKSP